MDHLQSMWEKKYGFAREHLQIWNYFEPLLQAYH